MNYRSATQNILPIKPTIRKIDTTNWLKMKYENGKIVYGDGQKSPKEEQEEYEKTQEYINYQMEQVCYNISLNLYKYAKQYDEIHGEGAYERAYVLDPIYENLDDDFEFELGIESEKKANDDSEYNVNAY